MNNFKNRIIEDLSISMSRNVQGFKFPKKLKDVSQTNKLTSIIKNACDDLFENTIIYTQDLTDFEKKSIFYSKIASKNLVENDLSAIIINKTGDLKIYVNDFDHIKIYCNRDVSSLDELFKIVSILDDELSKRIPYLYDNKYGYLTSQLNLLGTGLRISFKAFLFASVKNNNLKKIISIAEKYDLILFNDIEDSSTTYDYTFEFMNKHAINLSEIQIINNVKNAINEIMIFEEQEIKNLLYFKNLEIKDIINRSLSILKNAYILEYVEFLRNLSNIRIGVALNLINLKEEDLDNLKEKLSPVGLCRILKNEDLDNNNQQRATLSREFFKKVKND